MTEGLEDYNLPSTAVLKIIKEAFPDNISIGKDAKSALARAGAVFILYLTSNASQVAQKSNRKTILGHDIVEAMEHMEFVELIEPLTECYNKMKYASQTSKETNGGTEKSSEDEDQEEQEPTEEEDVEEN